MGFYCTKNPVSYIVCVIPAGYPPRKRGSGFRKTGMLQECKALGRKKVLIYLQVMLQSVEIHTGLAPLGTPFFEMSMLFFPSSP
jgi:hypothetical protein